LSKPEHTVSWQLRLIMARGEIRTAICKLRVRYHRMVQKRSYFVT